MTHHNSQEKVYLGQGGVPTQQAEVPVIKALLACAEEHDESKSRIEPLQAQEPRPPAPCGKPLVRCSFCNRGCSSYLRRRGLTRSRLHGQSQRSQGIPQQVRCPKPQEAAMIEEELKARIVRLAKAEKWRVSTIAKQVGVHHSTVSHVLKEAGVDRPVQVRPRMVDPYVPFLKKTLEEYPSLCASRLYQMVKERGYPGQQDHFRAVVAPYRPRRSAEAYLRLRTLPGEQGQVDWGHFGKVCIGAGMRILSAFVMVLSYSRQLYLRFFYGQSQSMFLLGHQGAFELFEGVPRVVLYDNLKSVVLERQGDAIRFHPELLKFAAHYQFEPRPVAVRRGNQKGRVERAIQYIRHGFFAGRKFDGLADLNEQAMQFCQGLSQQRRLPQDQTLTVAEAFLLERPRLLPLPAVPYPVHECIPVSVGKTPYVRFDKNDYSVPYDRVMRTLQVHATVDQVRVLDGIELVATHPRSYDQGQQVEDPEHIQELLERKKDARVHRGMSYLTLSVPRAQEFLVQLAQRGGNLGSATAAMARLLAHYGPIPLQQAIEEALAHGAVHTGAIRHILDRRYQEQHKLPPLALTLPKDPRLCELVVVPHTLASYDTLTTENSDDPNPDDLF